MNRQEQEARRQRFERSRKEGIAAAVRVDERRAQARKAARELEGRARERGFRK